MYPEEKKDLIKLITQTSELSLITEGGMETCVMQFTNFEMKNFCAWEIFFNEAEYKKFYKVY